MEIYNHRARWLSIVFFIPAVLVFLLEIDVLSHDDDLPWYVSYIIISVCVLVSLQCFFASTRLYFDNQSKHIYQVRKYFYGKKIVSHSYSEIKNIEVRFSRKVYSSPHQPSGPPRYKVGFTEKTTMFGQEATRFEQLREFGGEQKDYKEAMDFAKNVSEYSGIRLHDDSQVISVRPL